MTLLKRVTPILVFVLAIVAAPAVFAAPAPIQISGNPSCATLNASANPAFAHITTNWEFKVDPPVAGTLPLVGSGVGGGMPQNANMSLNLAYSSGNVLTDWSLSWLTSADLDRLVSAVIVKGGPNGANVYPYNPLDNGDTGSFTVPGGQNGISHLSFCFQPYTPPPPPPPTPNIIIVKQVETIDNSDQSSQAFSFSSSQAIFVDGTQSAFALTDDNAGPGVDTAVAEAAPGSQVVVTENLPLGWDLLDITCTAGVANVDLANRRVTITAPAAVDPAITCTFTNGQARPSAADVELAGKVVDHNGRGIGGAIVTLVNLATGEQFQVRTNSFGHYGFQGLEAMNVYNVGVAAARYRFSEPVRSVVLQDSIGDFTFQANR